MKRCPMAWREAVADGAAAATAEGKQERDGTRSEGIVEKPGHV